MCIRDRALYRAKTDGNGNILIVDGQPQYDEAQLIEEWMTDDLSDYTENYETSTNFVDRIKNFLGFRGNTSFIASFEEKYQEDVYKRQAHFTPSGSGRRADKLCSRWEYQCCNASSCIGFHG